MKHKYELLKSLETTIKDTIPLPLSGLESKRSVLPVVGDLMSTLFGVGTSKEIGKEGEQVQQLAVAFKIRQILSRKRSTI